MTRFQITTMINDSAYVQFHDDFITAKNTYDNIKYSAPRVTLSIVIDEANN